MNPYAELEVPRDADAAAVKRAYRAKAHRAHPDKPGGDAQRFQVVQAAYDVLSDPERRARFDRSGETAMPPDAHSQRLQAIAAMALQLIDRVGDVEHTDLHALMVQAMQEQIATMRQNKRQLEAKIGKQERAMKRFERKGDGENIIARLIEGSNAQLRCSVAAIEEQVKVGEGILEALAEYRYEVDVRSSIFDQMAAQQAQSNMWAR